MRITFIEQFRHLLLLTAILVLALGGSGCDRKYSQKEGGPPEQVRLAAYAGSYGFLPFIAQEQGLFAANGLAVRIDEYGFGLKALDALLAGQADIATAADFVLTSYSFEHADLRVLATIAISTTDEVVFRTDRGIEKPADLVGKRIGVPARTKAEYFLARFLTFHGVDYSEVKTIDLEPEAIMAALAAGTLDAASIWEPFASRIKKRLAGRVANWPAQHDQAFYYLLIARESWIKAHQPAIERLLSALVTAEDQVAKQPDTAQQFVARRFQYELPFVQEIWRKNRFTVTLPQEMLLQMEDGGRWRIRQKLTTQTTVPNYLRFISFEGLTAVKPEAVTIVH